MAENTKIEWCDMTFNPWIGCTKIGPGCDHCYAEVWHNRFKGGNWGPGNPRRRTSEANWKKPTRWNNDSFWQCGECGWRSAGKERSFTQTDTPACGACWSLDLVSARPRVFCASLADVFDNAVDQMWRDDLWSLIYATPNLDWLLLTKRIGNVIDMVPIAWRNQFPNNVWMGATIVNQEEADRDLLKLLKLPAAVRFLSMEPLLGAVDLTKVSLHAGGQYRNVLDGRCHGFFAEYEGLAALDWVIGGGESGPGARPMHPDWSRSLRDQCKGADVSFFMKQMGGPVKRSMPAIPPDLLIREFPNV